MSRRDFLGITALALAALGAAGAPAAPSDHRQRPNFLVVMADDVTHTDVGCYGGTNVKTPNIDRLAEQGLKFNYAYLAMSMCAPCRQELYSGVYPMRSGATWNHSQSKPGTKSIGHYLGDLGYRVGLAGKQHIGPRPVYPFENVAGFEPSCTSLTAKADQEGIRRFMAANDAQPFCLVVALVLAHAPWNLGDPGQFDLDKLKLPPHFADTPQVRQDYAKYLAEIGLLDRQVGNILKTLGETGKADDTLVIFTSEQGGQWPGAKWTNWEQGLHTALMVRWPGKIGPGRRTDALIQYADVVPTLVDAAGGDSKTLGLDGISFLDVLLGKKSEHRRYVYGMHNNVPEGPPYPIRTIRTGEFRYIWNLAPQSVYIEKHMEVPKRWGDYWESWKKATQTDDHARRMFQRYRRRPAEELYGSNEDVYELDNLADDPQYAEIKSELRAELQRWMKAQGDPGAAQDTQAMFDANLNLGRKPRKQTLQNGPTAGSASSSLGTRESSTARARRGGD